MKQKLLEEHTFGSKGCSGITTDFIFATNYVCIRRSRTHGRQVLIHEYLFLKIVASKPISEKSPAFPECWLSQQALIYFIYYLAAPSTNRKQPKTFRYHTTKPIYIRLLIIILMLISFWVCSKLNITVQN